MHLFKILRDALFPVRALHRYFKVLLVFGITTALFVRKSKLADFIIELLPLIAECAMNPSFSDFL